MYRPGGFPEWTPKEQYLFDSIVRKIEQIFVKHNYEHIWTPAVESIDILKKGGDVIEQQVFGLYGMAQGPEDIKDYALHFDLTIPLARYILDHKNDIVFPFSRYQMQPVRRGERTQRGRYKEFWQFDVDTIRPTDMNVGSRYDVQSLYVIDKAMQELTDSFNVDIQRIAKISHLGLTKEFLASLGANEYQTKSIMKALDSYYKKPEEVTVQILKDIVGSEITQTVMEVIHTKDRSFLQHLPSFSFFDDVCKQLDLLGMHYEYDICIVRGQNYYSGTVVEWMDPTDTGFGSLAGGGRYDNLTTFIDPKQSFSGVGASLGRFVYLMMEKITNIQKQDTYLFINFEDTKDDILSLYRDFLDAGLQCELYPTDVKLAKQFGYADKKGFTYCVLYGAGEKEKGVFVLKNMESGESAEWKKDFSYGIIPVLEVNGEKKILMVQQTDSGNRCFPKGHPEGNETPIQTAKREFQEEVGIKDIVIDEKNSVTEKYLVTIHSGSRKGEKVLKTVTYFVGEVDIDLVQIDSKEVIKARRLTYKEALQLPLFTGMRKIIEGIRTML